MDRLWSALVIDDDPGVRQSLRLCLEVDQARVMGVGTAAGALEALDRSQYDVVFLDLWLQHESGLAILPELLRRQPGIGVVIITAFASIESAVEAIRQGAVDYLAKPFTPEQVRSAARRVVTARVLNRQITELNHRIIEAEGENIFDSPSPVYRAFLQTASRAAASDASILLRGESGTGKTIFARWLRKQSRRADGPFVTVHCPLLSNDLMSSTLFGHRKGAFTGAVSDATGKVEEAEGGTIFLDEIADLSADAQARLLRFLKDQTYERVGEAQERKADVRVIAATNRSLENDVATGRFREDLYFRIHVISLALPSLRQRAEDIVPLAHHYLTFFGNRQGRHGLSFSPSCQATIASFHWPGNLRQLRNAVERAVILAPEQIVEASDLGLQASSNPAVPGTSDPSTASTIKIGDNLPLEVIEREHLAQVVARASSFEQAARILGIDATTLQRKRKRYGLA